MATSEPEPANVGSATPPASRTAIRLKEFEVQLVRGLRFPVPVRAADVGCQDWWCTNGRA